MPTSDAPRPTTALPNQDPSKLKTSLAPMLRNPLMVAGAGLFLGIIVGLFIGWVVWPVSWSSAWPGDLNPEAKAQYLAAVAESYVYYGTDEAAETARNRLFDLNEDLAAEIQAAQQFFEDHPQRDSRIYQNNLQLLAQRLNLETSGDAFDATAPDDASGESSSTTSSVLTWMFALLAAVALIGGGIYALRRFSRNRQPEPDGFYEDEFDDDEYDEAEQPTFTPVQPDTRQAAPYPPIADDYDFDDDSEDSGVVYKPARPVDELDDALDATVIDDDELDESDDLDDEPQETPPPTRSPYAPPAPEPPASTSSPWPEAAVAASLPAARSQRPAPSLAGKSLGTFTAHYQAGLIDYDQSFNIVDPESGRYIGECGMGVNMKNGILQNNPEHVIALDVWLFDKKTDKSLTNQTRVLLSEYVIDNKLDQAFTRERPNDPTPLVAQPGLNFQLRGQHLVLDCHIVEASYMRNAQASGIFQSIRIDMTVRVKDS